MAFTQRQQPKVQEKPTVTMTFGDVKGVDFRSDDTTSFRSPEAVNMYRSRLGLWETHVGFRKIGYVGKRTPIWGIHKFIYNDRYHDVKEKVLVHAGSKMYIWDNYPDYFTPDNLTEIFAGLASRRTKFFEFQNTLLILDGESIYYFDGEVMDYITHKATIPQTYTGVKPDRSMSDPYQPRSFINKWQYEGFIPDGTSTKYKLGLKNIDADTLKIWQGADNPDDPGNTVYTEGATGNLGFTVNRTTGEVTFNSAPAAAAIAGKEELFIQYAFSSPGYPERINNCTEIITFDNRVFLTGNPAFPNVIFWSGNADWAYYSEVDYSERAGTSSAPVICLQQMQENKFLTIKKDTHQDGAYAIWSQYSLNNDYIAETYLASSGNSTIGCISNFAHAVFVDDNVFLSSNGLNAISRNLAVSLERNIEHRSTLVDSKLLAEDLENAIMEQHRGYLYILFPNGHCYMANSATKCSDVSNFTEYEWAYLEELRLYEGTTAYAPTQLKSFNDKELYMCSSNGYLCKFYFDRESPDGSFPTDTYNYDGRAIKEYTDTPFSWFGVQNRFKKLIRKYNDLYCDVRTHADVEVLFHTEKKFMEDSKVLQYKADLFTFNNIDFATYTDEQGNTESDFSFKTLPPVSFVLKKLKGKRFRRLQLRIRSGGINHPVIFKSLMVDAYVLTRKLK